MIIKMYLYSVFVSFQAVMSQLPSKIKIPPNRLYLATLPPQKFISTSYSSPLDTHKLSFLFPKVVHECWV